MATKKDKVKIAVELKGELAQFIELDLNKHLETVVAELCEQWSLVDPEQYSLQFSHNTQLYITAKNLHEVKNGDVLTLTPSPTKASQDIINTVESRKGEDREEALSRLRKLSPDITFAAEFIRQDGLPVIITALEESKYGQPGVGYALESLMDLMDHGIESWDILEPQFIAQIISVHANSRNENADPVALQASLSILEAIVLSSQAKYPLVEKEIKLDVLIYHLQNSTAEVQLSSIRLINALFKMADELKKKKFVDVLNSKSIRVVIHRHIIQNQNVIGKEMVHQLYVLQVLMLNLLEQKMMTPVNVQDAMERDKLTTLRKIAFDADVDSSPAAAVKRQGSLKRDFKKLGFSQQSNPLEDFTETPPGVLALDLMLYFAKNHPETYTKVVLENSCRADEHECPFGRMAIQLVKLLRNIFKIGEAPSEQGNSYYAMFFTHDHPFEEFFCICIQLLSKTWKEMRATSEDFEKVMTVVQEQITRSLATNASSLEKFRNKLASLTFTDITNLWQQERCMREEWENQSRPIVELREQIKPEIMQLIQRQRLAHLCDGTTFAKFQKGRSKEKFWHCKLSPNHKVFHYGDTNEDSCPGIEELHNRLPVDNIKGLAVGKDCPHMKEQKARKSAIALAFSILRDNEQDAINFIVPDEKLLAIWTDGINALLGNEMTSFLAKQDLETLLSMEIKLRLLDTEGLTIPNEPPPIPAPPLSYDFVN